MSDVPPPSGPPPAAPPPPPPGSPPPPPPGSPPPPPAGWAAPPGSEWRSLRGLTTALTILLALVAAACAFLAYAWINRIGVESDLIDGTFGADIVKRANDADDLVGAAVLITGLLSLAIFVLIIIWTYRAMKNNEALGRQGARFTPGWGIAGWLIPLVNLVIPVLILQDLWRGSDPGVPRNDPAWRSAKGSGLIGIYWAAHIIGTARFGGGGGEANLNDEDELKNLRTSDTIGAVGSIVAILAAILAIQVLRKITVRQEQVRDGVVAA